MLFTEKLSSRKFYQLKSATIWHMWLSTFPFPASVHFLNKHSEWISTRYCVKHSHYKEVFYHRGKLPVEVGDSCEGNLWRANLIRYVFSIKCWLTSEPTVGILKLWGLLKPFQLLIILWCKLILASQNGGCLGDFTIRREPHFSFWVSLGPLQFWRA